MGLLLAGAQAGDEDAELAKRRRILIGLAMHALLALLARQQRVLRIVRVEGQRLRKQIDIIPLRPRAEPRVQNVVRPRHALDDVAAEIRMDAIRRHADRLAGPQRHVIHQQRRDEDTVVELGVLLPQPLQQPGDVACLAEVRLRERLHLPDGLGHDGRRERQQRLDHAAQHAVVEPLVLGEEALERFQLHRALDLVERLPAREELEVGQRDRDLGLVVGVAEFLRVFLVQLLSELLVGVDLEGERFGEGEDLWRLVLSCRPRCLSIPWEDRAPPGPIGPGRTFQRAAGSSSDIRPVILPWRGDETGTSDTCPSTSSPY